MTRAAKLIYTIAILVGLFLGSFWGFRETMLHLSAVASARRTILQTELENFSVVQYKNADSDHAKIALLTYVKFLEQMEKAQPESIPRLKLSIAFTRLALLEDKAHNAEQSQRYMDEARLWCRSDRGSECSESQMKKITAAFDNRQSMCEP